MNAAEQFFAEAEPFYVTKLFDFLPDVYYFVKNKDLEFVRVNQAFVKLFGYTSAQEVIGLTDRDMVSPYLAIRYEKDDRAILATGEPFVEVMEPVSSSDELVSMHITSKMPVHNRQGEIIGIAAITRDFGKTNHVYEPYKEMQPVIEKIEKEFRQEIKTSTLAALVNMSNSTFLRHFKEHFHTTPVKYLRRIRMNEVCKLLLKSTKSLCEISYEVGFCDQSYMTREFRKYSGLSPSQYRQKYS